MEKNQERRRDLRVIIVGASISGLTLANALARAGIEFVVLEKQKDVEIQKGASIVIFSNGFVALDQLGLYEKLTDITLPLLANNARSGREARLIRHYDAFELASKRTGYPIVMLERLGLIKLLYNNLPKKDQVFTSHQVSRVDYSPKGVYVYCNNGAFFEGDLVVGADGIHSIVRSEMWRQAAKTDLHAFEIKDKASMSAEFNIIFGFSRGVKGLVVGHDQRVHGKDFAILALHAQNDTTYWFLWNKLDKKYNTPNIPRYSQDEAAAVAQKYLDCHVNETVLFKDLWDNRVTYSMHPVEEYLAKRWTWNRFVAIGDAVHKFGPNNGQGGMAAIEDAAALANYIKKINESSSSSLDTTLIEQYLGAFEKLRERRVKSMDEESRLILRGDTLQGWVAYFMTHHLIPNIPDFIENSWTANAVGSVVIDYLPFPERARTGTMRLNTLLGNGTQDSLLIRTFRALPLLFVLFGFLYAGKIVLEPVHTLLPNYRTYAMSTGDWRNSRLFNVDAYSEPQSRLTNPASELEVLALSYHSIIRHNDSFYTLVLLLFDFHSVYGIMLIEGYRRGTSLTFAQLPILFSSLLKARGCGAISIYSLCYYIQNSPQNFITADQRYVRKSYAQMLLPAITIAYTVPTLYMLFLAPRTSSFIDIISLWQFFPVIVPMVHTLLARLVPDTTIQDRIDNPWVDLPHLRRFYAATGLVSAISYWYVNFMGPSSVAWMIVSKISRLYVTPGSMGDAWGVLLVIDYLAEILAIAILVILQFRDLKAIGRLEVSWAKLVLVYITLIILCGPGAAAVIMWAYREEILKNIPQAPRTRLS